MKKLKFVFDKIDNNIPLMNGFSDTPSYLYRDLYFSNLDREFLSLDDLEINNGSNDLLVYPIELLKFHFSEVFSNLNPIAIDKIKKNNISILIYFPSEGFNINFSFREHWLDIIHSQFETFGLHNNKKYLIFGNLKIEEDYNDTYLNSTLEKLVVKFSNGSTFTLNPDAIDETLIKRISQIKFNKVYGLNYFETKYQLNLKNRWAKKYFKDREEILLDEVLSSNKEFNFLSYNGNFRPGRVALVSELIRHGLDSNSYLSFIGGNSIKIENCLKSALELVDGKGKVFLLDYVNNWKPKEIDINSEQKQSDILSFQKNHYLDTYFSLVSETEIDKKILFLTEKIFKPIVFYHPFIVWGQPYILRHLKSLGYQTFPEMFNEAYDEIEDDKVRLNFIIKEISTFAKLEKKEKDAKFASIIQKLQHNRDLFFSEHNRLQIELTNIFNDILNDSD